MSATNVGEVIPRVRPSALAAAHVVVLHGGTSGEREVSLLTGHAVVAALSNAGDGRGPRRVSSIEIDARGGWLVEGRTLAPHAALAALAPLDVVFLGLHGGRGEDGTLQAWLELEGVAYTGSNARASALCMDKLALRGVAAQRGIAVAPGTCVTAAEWAREPAVVRARIASLAPNGWVVKPRSGGSSVATAVLSSLDGLDAALTAAFANGDDALVEARVLGVEVSCGVLGGGAGRARALPPIEIRPRASTFFDYAEKYSEGGAEEVCPPRSLSAAASARVQELAVATHEAARCSGYSRTDFIVVDGEPVLLEVNTLPGLTPRSLLPQEAAAVGLDYRALCLWIATEAFERAVEHA
ncbi:MAG: D-alanine--D-alanine ligase [Planctomycetes bacterium]|nr:D-alanine--D-alanine ligase [Planctomycetota bacterium]